MRKLYERILHALVVHAYAHTHIYMSVLTHIHTSASSKTLLPVNEAALTAKTTTTCNCLLVAIETLVCVVCSVLFCSDSTQHIAASDRVTLTSLSGALAFILRFSEMV